MQALKSSVLQIISSRLPIRLHISTILSNFLRCEILLYFTLQAVLVWITAIKLLMVLELSLWVAKVCTSLPHTAPQGYVAASLKTRGSYLQIILCVLFPFRLMCQQAIVNLAAVGITAYQ